MDLKNMSDAEKRKRIQELKDKINEVQKESSFYKAMQLGLKLVLNGSYGAFCHPAFTISNTNIANSITSLAREVINFMLDKIEHYFYDNWGTDVDIHKLLGSMYISKCDDKYYIHRIDGKLIDEWGRIDDDKSTGITKIFEAYHLDNTDIRENDINDFVINDKKYSIIHKIFICDFSDVKSLSKKYIVQPIPESKKFDETKGIREVPITIYGDTDSVNSCTSISYENGQCSIEELYNRNIINGSAGNTIKGHESVNCKEKVLNYSKEKELYYAPVKRIIRHKVSKAKWCLKTKSGKEIIVTNDHSMIVFRDGVQIEVKPCNILKTDKILCVKN